MNLNKVYIDTREKIPWDFTFYGFEQEFIKLDTGDYFFEDFPDICIERKRSTGEISINLGSKWKQFEREMQRMSTFKYAYIICEFPIEHLDIFPEKSGIARDKIHKIRMNSSFLKMRLFSNCNKYNITPLFFNNATEAQNGVIEILKSYDRHK